MHDILRVLAASENKHWSEYLAELVVLYKSTPHTSTNVSPHFLVFRNGLDHNNDTGGDIVLVSEHVHGLRDAHKRAETRMTTLAILKKQKAV